MVMPYPIRFYFKIYENLVQILLMLSVLFTQDSEVEDLFYGASRGSEPNLFFINYLCGLGFEPIQENSGPLLCHQVGQATKARM